MLALNKGNATATVMNNAPKIEQYPAMLFGAPLLSSPYPILPAQICPMPIIHAPKFRKIVVIFGAGIAPKE